MRTETTNDTHLDLVQLELQELTESVMDPGAEQPFGLYAWASDHPGAELGRHVERVVFGDVFGNSPELLAAEYGAYEASSLFFCVVDHRRRLPAGAARIVLPSEAGFKSLDDLVRFWDRPLDDVLARTAADIDPATTWDIATLAVDADYRGGKTNGLISLALYQGVSTATLHCDVDWWVTVLDVVVLDVIQSQTGRPFSYFHGVGPKRYLDSPSSVPLWCNLPEWDRRFAQADPAMHQIVCRGEGLESAVAPLDLDRLYQPLETRAPRLATGTR